MLRQASGRWGWRPPGDCAAGICRPVGLTSVERRQVVDHARSRLGHRYDLKNVIDLARYLLPTPPVGWRRAMLNLGSGDPTRAICSTLIAQCFDAVKYPILPQVGTVADASDGGVRRVHSPSASPLVCAAIRQADVDAGVRFSSSGLCSRGREVARHCWRRRSSDRNAARRRQVIMAGSGSPLAGRPEPAGLLRATGRFL